MTESEFQALAARFRQACGDDTTIVPDAQIDAYHRESNRREILAQARRQQQLDAEADQLAGLRGMSRIKFWLDVAVGKHG